MYARVYPMIHKPFYQFGLGFWFQNIGNGPFRILHIHLLVWCLEISWLNTRECAEYIDYADEHDGDTE